jgi:Flp pilus assembly protein TadD
MDANPIATTLDLAERHFAAGRLSEAEPLFRRVLGISGDDVRVLHFLGYIARQNGNLAGAADSYAAAVALDPDNGQLHNNLAETQRALGQDLAAVASYRRAAALLPDEALIHYNLGTLLHALHREDEAVDSMQRAVAIQPTLIEARSEMCPALCALGRYPEALEQYRAALAQQPDNWNARYLESLALIALGDWASGWELHEARWRSELGTARRRLFAQPYWLGEQDLTDRTILLHAEQGYGDTLQFVRYAPMVAARGGRVLLEVQPGLAPLLADMPGVAGVITRGDALPAFDLHTSLMSLPRAFRTTTQTVPADVPYLAPPAARIARWRERIGTSRALRIGIAWSGTPSPWNRAVPLELLRPLAQRPDSELHTLQTEIWPADRITLNALPQVHDHSDQLADFADTAALVSLMDLVISIDTAAAHLAGALGMPTWLLLPVGPDYRWMLERPDCPWYPTMRLFRQRALHDWQSVVDAVMRKLDALP